MEQQSIIIYNTQDGKASVSLYAKDGSVWMNQNQLAELFDTSKQNIGQHIASLLEDNELDTNSVVKNYFTTADEIDTLNRLVVIFLEIAELRAKDRIDLTISFWKENVHRILRLNDKKILANSGSISNTKMEQKVSKIYDEFNSRRNAFEAELADQQEIEEIESIIKKRNT